MPITLQQTKLPELIATIEEKGNDVSYVKDLLDFAEKLGAHAAALSEAKQKSGVLITNMEELQENSAGRDAIERFNGKLEKALKGTETVQKALKAEVMEICRKALQATNDGDNMTLDKSDTYKKIGAICKRQTELCDEGISGCDKATKKIEAFTNEYHKVEEKSGIGNSISNFFKGLSGKEKGEPPKEKASKLAKILTEPIKEAKKVLEKTSVLCKSCDKKRVQLILNERQAPATKKKPSMEEKKIQASLKRDLISKNARTAPKKSKDRDSDSL